MYDTPKYGDVNGGGEVNEGIKKYRQESRLQNIIFSENMWGQVAKYNFSSAKIVLSTSSPNSTVLTLGIVKTCLRLAPRYESKAVCFLQQNPLGLKT